MPHYYTLNPSEMTELDELSVKSLSVIQKNSATAMSDTAKILVVGLGGMGLSTVHQLKRTLTERVGKLRDADIRFLALDTDTKDISNKVNDGPLLKSETHHLFNKNLGALMALPVEKRPEQITAILPPESANFNPRLAGEGANQVRLAGRLSLMDSDVFNQIREKIQAAISGLGEFVTRILEVHVIAGIGGGTGSGLCIDIPYIIRQVASELGVPDTNMRIFGHIYLPNVYDRGGTMNIGHAYRNGYAALKEIDYYMNIEENGETFDATYAGKQISTAKNIFEFCTLIGGKIAEAIIIDDPKKAAINACVSNLVNQVTRVITRKEVADLGKEASMADIFTSQSFRDNLKAALNTVMLRGDVDFHPSGNYKYSCIGSSSLQFPTDAIIEYFTGEVFKKTIAQLESNATMLKQADVDAFAKNVIAPDELMQSAMAEFEQEAATLIGNHAWNKTAVANAELDPLMSATIDKIFAKFDKDGNLVNNACAKASGKASAIFSDPSKGPYFLARLLTANSKQGGGIVGYYEKLNGYANACNTNVSKLTEAVAGFKQQRAALADTMQKFGNFNRNLEGYKTLQKDIWRDTLKIKFYQKLVENYYLDAGKRIGACYQIRNVLDHQYVAYVDIVTYIGEIMAANADARKSAVFDDKAPGSIFGLTDEVFDAIKNSVRLGVENKLKNFGDTEVKEFASAWLENIMSNPDKWALSESRVFGESPVASCMRNFIDNYEPFDSVTKKNFAGYFADAYKNETTAQKDVIVGKIVNHLKINASPMFNVFPSFSWASVGELCHRFMIIPSGMGEEWGDLFDKQLDTNTKNKNVLVSPDQNAIYNYTMFAALPIWIHADIQKYEDEYYKLNVNSPGVHINENESMDPPYADYPSLFPPQQWYRAKEGIYDYTDAHEKAFREKLADMIDKAKATGIIRCNDQGYYIVELLAHRPDPNANDKKEAEKAAEELESFFNSYKEEKDNYSDELLLGGTHLRNEMKARFGSTFVPIKRIGNLNSTKESDLFELIRKQMKLVGKIKNELAYVEANIDPVVDDYNKEIIERVRRKRVFVFMLYGLIAPDDRGVWNYYLGERAYKIISKLDVVTGDASGAAARYMEMMVYKKFYSLEKAAEHLVLLNERVSTMNYAINDGSNDLDILRANHAKYSEKATQALNGFKTKVAMGDKLTKEEVEIKAFYEQMKNDMDGIMSIFSAD